MESRTRAAMKGVIGELVVCTTEDGLRLHGFWMEPNAADSIGRAVVCLHGVAGNFYSNSPFDAFDRRLVDLGFAVLRVNTRGHDLIAPPLGGRKHQGSAFEIVADCRLDIAAWRQWLAHRGYARCSLLGHSLGAVKVLFHAAGADPFATDSPRMEKIVALSPPLLSYRQFVSGKRGEEFLACIAEAEKSVLEGLPTRLLDIRFPVPQTISAASFLDKYGQTERYNLLRWVGDIRSKTLFVFGALELQGNSAFDGLPEKIAAAVSSSTAQVRVIEAANHSYTGCYERLAECVETFLLAAPDE